MFIVRGVRLDSDIEWLFTRDFASEGCYPQFLERVVGVGDEFSEEHVPVGIEAVDDDFAESSDVGLFVAREVI